MKRSKFSEEQVVYALRQAEGGTPVSTFADSWESVTPRSMRGRKSTPTWG
jgi:hypothetical protein